MPHDHAGQDRVGQDRTGQDRAGQDRAVKAHGVKARVGRTGEMAAAAWYEAHGCSVLERNWRCSAGELDLVLEADGGELVVFCEVKTRTGAVFGSPFEAVTASKKRRLRQLAGRFMAETKPVRPGTAPKRLRIDVAAVRVGPDGRPVVEVIEDAC